MKQTKVRDTTSGQYTEKIRAITDRKGTVAEKTKPDKVKRFIENLVKQLDILTLEDMSRDLLRSDKNFAHKTFLENTVNKTIREHPDWQ